MASFAPRQIFPTLDSLPRAYFLGHHRAGLNKMKTMLNYTDLVIECRDYRVPYTSRNPLFEQELAGRERLIVYTKKDLGSKGRHDGKIKENAIQSSENPNKVLFSNHKDKASIRKVLEFASDHATAKDSLTGSRIMVVGMPNVGKSSLLNALRQIGVHKGKAAFTGAQPGVTRRVGTAVKIIEGRNGTPGTYLMDTPGVFTPYVPDSEAMLKLALCGSVKDTVVAPTILADYLLYAMNLHDPTVYAEYSIPTNDVTSFLNAIAHKTGRLQKGGIPDEEAAALWAVSRWRQGHLGTFLLDEVTKHNLSVAQRRFEERTVSWSQARRAAKESRRRTPKRNHVDID